MTADPSPARVAAERGRTERRNADRWHPSSTQPAETASPVPAPTPAGQRDAESREGIEAELRQWLADNPYFGDWDEWSRIAYDKIPTLPRTALAHLYGRHPEGTHYVHCVLCDLLRDDQITRRCPVTAAESRDDRISDEAEEAGAAALHKLWLRCTNAGVEPSHAAEALAAAVPHLERQIRESIAGEIEARRDVPVAGPDSHERLSVTRWNQGIATAARIVGDWTYRIRQWARLLTAHLQASDEHIARAVRLRNSACPECGTTQVVLDPDGDRRVVPALLVTFVGDLIRAIQCLNPECERTWWRGDVPELAEALGLDPTPAKELTP